MLTERTLLEKVEAFPDGKISVHRVIIIERDGKEVSRVPEVQKLNPGDKLPSEDRVTKAVALALWSATDITKATTAPGDRRGRLYRSKGSDVTLRPTLAGTVSAPPDTQIDDVRAVAIRHRGAEQGRHRPNYGGTSPGFAPAEPEHKIRHRGKDQH